MHPAIEAYNKRRKDRMTVASFKERRQKRLDDADPKSWITVNGNHIPLDEEGDVIGGQPKAFGESTVSAVNGGTPSKSEKLLSSIRSVIDKHGKRPFNWEMLGYDAIDAYGYTVILNRSKCIFLEPEGWDK